MSSLKEHGEELIWTAPGAGAVLGVYYWEAAIKSCTMDAHQIVLDCGCDAAAAHQGLSAGFHVAIDPSIPAFETLSNLALHLGRQVYSQDLIFN